VFILLDDVQFTKPSYIHRVKIKTPQGSMWLNVPTQKTSRKRILDVLINNAIHWKDEHLKTFHMNYAKAPYFNKVMEGIIKPIYSKGYERLIDFNFDLLKSVLSKLGITNKIYFSSSFNIQAKKSARIVALCKEVGASVYISGLGAKSYNDETLFKESNIQLKYMRFKHPIYPQRFGEFIPGLSIIDLLFNEGFEGATRVLNKLSEEVMFEIGNK